MVNPALPAGGTLIHLRKKYLLSKEIESGFLRVRLILGEIRACVSGGAGGVGGWGEVGGGEVASTGLDCDMIENSYSQGKPCGGIRAGENLEKGWLLNPSLVSHEEAH